MFLKLLFLLSFSTQAATGKFTIISENEQAPFEGALFDIEATATLITAKHEIESKCDLAMEYELDKQSTEFQLEKANLQAHLMSTQREHNLLTEQKDKEIMQLRESLKKHSPRNKWLWFFGGIVTGGSVAYYTYGAINE